MYRLLLLATAALILYGSLYPWALDFHRQPGNPLEILLSHWPRTLDRFALRDVFVNVLLYLPLGAAACLSLPRRVSAPLRVAFAAALGFALSTTVELLQMFDPPRTPSAFDIVNNLAGSLAGGLAAAVFSHGIESAVAHRARQWKTAPAAFALLLLWAAVQLYPCFPALATTALRQHLRVLFHTPFSFAAFPLAAAEWLAAALLVEAAGQSHPRLKFLVLGLLLPARLLIAGPGVPVTDVAAFAAALLLWRFLPAHPAPRYLAAAGLLLAAVVLHGLRPFHLPATAAPFAWTPFGGFLNMDWFTGGRLLLRKAYDYGAVAGLCRFAGTGYLGAGAAVAVPLALLEFAQRWFPPHVAESTDPLLAILIAAGLWLLDRHYRVPVRP